MRVVAERIPLFVSGKMLYLKHKEWLNFENCMLPLQEASGKYPQSDVVAASLPTFGSSELHAGIVIAVVIVVIPIAIIVPAAAVFIPKPGIPGMPSASSPTSTLSNVTSIAWKRCLAGRGRNDEQP